MSKSTNANLVHSKRIQNYNSCHCFLGHVRKHAASFGHRTTGHIVELRFGPSRVRCENLHQKLHRHLSVGHCGFAVTYTGPYDQ